jgi:hypothetical protein
MPFYQQELFLPEALPPWLVVFALMSVEIVVSPVVLSSSVYVVLVSVLFWVVPVMLWRTEQGRPAKTGDVT